MIGKNQGMNDRNTGVLGEEKLTGMRAWIGVITCLMYCIGIPILRCSFSPSFGMLSYATYVLAVVLFGKTAIVSLKGKSVGKIALWTLIASVLVIALSGILFGNIIEPILMQCFHLTRFQSANTASLTNQIQNQGIAKTVWLAVGYTVIGPIVEELLYRVCVFRVFYQKNRVLGHLGTAFLFGLQHVFVAAFYGQHPQEFFLIGSYMIVSLIMTKVYVKTKTPIPGMLAHMLTNGIGVWIMLSR